MSSKYRQIIDWIENRVAAGELTAGDRIESENQISNQFHMSRQTVRKALSELIRQGVLESRQGSGTFIRESVNLPLSLPKDILTRTVTIVSTYIDGYIFLKVLKTMAETLEENGYSVKIVFTNNRHETERNILEEILRDNEKGPMIVEPVMSGLPNTNIKYYRQLKKLGIPILFFHTFYPDLDIPHISMDDVAAGKKATEYLISRGHQKIGAIFKLDDGQGKRRYCGYLEAMEEAGLEYLEKRVCWIDTWEMERLSAEKNEEIWQRMADCTAILCYNDQVAASMIESAEKNGIRVPDEVSIMGIDNAEFSRTFSLPITTVNHPKEELGKEAALKILRMIEDPGMASSFEFPVQIVERESVCDFYDSVNRK